MEIERKFLLNEMPTQVEVLKDLHIQQYYLLLGEDEVRIRLTSEQTTAGTEHYCYLTTKRGSGLVREEQTIALPVPLFDILRQQSGVPVLAKTRHILSPDVMQAKGEAVVDVYHGFHEGLIVAEFEFHFKDEAERWSPPSWAEVEVTGVKTFSNAALWSQMRP